MNQLRFIKFLSLLLVCLSSSTLPSAVFAQTKNEDVKIPLRVLFLTSFSDVNHEFYRTQFDWFGFPHDDFDVSSQELNINILSDDKKQPRYSVIVFNPRYTINYLNASETALIKKYVSEHGAGLVLLDFMACKDPNIAEIVNVTASASYAWMTGYIEVIKDHPVFMDNRKPGFKTNFIQKDNALNKVIAIGPRATVLARYNSTSYPYLIVSNYGKGRAVAVFGQWWTSWDRPILNPVKAVLWASKVMVSLTEPRWFFFRYDDVGARETLFTDEQAPFITAKRGLPTLAGLQFDIASINNNQKTSKVREYYVNCPSLSVGQHEGLWGDTSLWNVTDENILRQRLDYIFNQYSALGIGHSHIIAAAKHAISNTFITGVWSDYEIISISQWHQNMTILKGHEAYIRNSKIGEYHLYDLGTYAGSPISGGWGAGIDNPRTEKPMDGWIWGIENALNNFYTYAMYVDHSNPNRPANISEVNAIIGDEEATYPITFPNGFKVYVPLLNNYTGVFTNISPDYIAYYDRERWLTSIENAYYDPANNKITVTLNRAINFPLYIWTSTDNNQIEQVEDFNHHWIKFKDDVYLVQMQAGKSTGTIYLGRETRIPHFSWLGNLNATSTSWN